MATCKTHPALRGVTAVRRPPNLAAVGTSHPRGRGQVFSHLTSFCTIGRGRASRFWLAAITPSVWVSTRTRGDRALCVAFEEIDSGCKVKKKKIYSRPRRPVFRVAPTCSGLYGLCVCTSFSCSSVILPMGVHSSLASPGVEIRAEVLVKNIPG